MTGAGGSRCQHQPIHIFSITPVLPCLYVVYFENGALLYQPMPLSSDLTGHPAQPQQPIRHYAMSDYLPSLKWPSALTFQTRATSPTEDAPLTALPECERTSLTQLTVQFTSALTAASLPSSDPWSSLNASQNSVLRDEILLRFLRFNSLQIDRTAKQLRSVLAWRAKSKISEQPVTVIRGMAAGIPVCIMDAVGRVGQRLFFASAEKYVKQDVDRRIQEIAVAKMFEHMLYDVDGPQVTGVDVVVDFMGFSTKNIDIFGLKTGVSTYLNYYPDIFHRIFLINYPKFLYGGKFHYMLNAALSYHTPEDRWI